MASGSLISVICDRVLDGHLPALFFGILTLYDAIKSTNVARKEEMGGKKVLQWVSGSIFFVKDPLYENTWPSCHSKV